MERTRAQARIAATIERSGLADAEVASLLGVDQSTAWRLRNHRIRKVAKHQARLDECLGPATDDEGEFSDLLAMARSSPALREALHALQKLLHEDA